jgi:nucleoside-diphosphate-sugar epimerase
MKRYLVTGGSGFIGSALVKRLVKEGHSVRVLDSNIRGVESRLNSIADLIDFVEADICDYKQVQKACREIDVVHHLAYINGTEYFYTMPERILEIAVKGMMNIIDACRENKIKELYVASSSETYQTPEMIPTPETERLIVPDPLNPRYSYGGGKILWELMAINFGRKYFDKVVIYRPHNVYGPDMGWEHVLPQFAVRLNKLVKETDGNIIDFPIQGNGEETRSFVYIDDFINGLMQLVQKGKHLNIYNIGTMEEVSIKGLAAIVGKEYNKKLNIISSGILQGSTSRRCPDISKIQKLGFRPKVSLGSGVRILVDWYKCHALEEQKIKT